MIFNEFKSSNQTSILCTQKSDILLREGIGKIVVSIYIGYINIHIKIFKKKRN